MLEDKKEKEKEVSKVENPKEKVVENKVFTVLKDLTLNKFYKAGQTIELSNKETIDLLLTNKYIK